MDVNRPDNRLSLFKLQLRLNFTYHTNAIDLDVPVLVLTCKREKIKISIWQEISVELDYTNILP